MVKRFQAPAALVLLLVTLAGAAGAQSAPKPALKDDTGFTSYASFEGTSDTDGQVYAFSPSVGYNFSRHIGMDFGVPFYFVRASSSQGGTSSNGLGNPALDLRLKFPNPVVNFASVLTGSAPVARRVSARGTAPMTGPTTSTTHLAALRRSVKLEFPTRLPTRACSSGRTRRTVSTPMCRVELTTICGSSSA